MLFIKPLCFLCLFLVFTLKKTPTLLLVYTFTIAVLLPGVVARWGGASHAHRGKGREGKGRRIRQKKGRTREEGRGEGACSFALTAWCSGLQTALDSNFKTGLSPLSPLGCWPGLLHQHLPLLPHREQDLGCCLPRRPPGMKYCTRAKTKGESGRRGKLGCRGPPPSPCTSLAATRSGRKGAPQAGL